MNAAYPQLPASLIIDIIDGRLNGLVFDDTVEFPLWEGPQSKDAEDYWLGKWRVIGPDEKALGTFDTKAQATEAINQFIRDHADKDYYFTEDREKIPVDELGEFCRMEIQKP